MNARAEFSAVEEAVAANLVAVTFPGAESFDDVALFEMPGELPATTESTTAEGYTLTYTASSPIVPSVVELGDGVQAHAHRGDAPTGASAAPEWLAAKFAAVEPETERYGATAEDWDHFLALAKNDVMPVVCNRELPISATSKLTAIDCKTPSYVDAAEEVRGLPQWTTRTFTNAERDSWRSHADVGIAIRCRNVRAIDVDITDPELARLVRMSVDMEHGLPCRMRSNSCKFLLAFRMAGDWKKAVINTSGGKIEFLASKQQFIAVGTHTSGVPYEWEGGLPGIPELTAEQFTALWNKLQAQFANDGAASSPAQFPACERDPAQPRELPGVDVGAARDRVIHYLENEAPLAHEGEGGDHTTFVVACKCKDLGVTQAECFDLMWQHWNDRCAPPWSADDLIDKVANAYKYGVEPVGSAAPEVQFPPVTAQATDAKHPNEQWLEKMNARYAVTNHMGTTMVHSRVHDPELGHITDEWITFDDLKRRHLHERVNVVEDNGRVAKKDIGTAWLSHPARRQYAREAFLPGVKAEPDVLNLWSGFALDPRRGDWSKLRWHIEHVICAGNAAAYGYVMHWAARLVQKPGEAGQVAIVLQGGEGTGKGTFARPLLKAFGRHGLHIMQAKHLTGAFNQHLRCVKLLFADEAMFAGNPEHRGPLYALITEDSVQIEAKGVDARTARNVLSIIMATNHDWAVPAGINARRFCVLRVSEKHRQDTEYFRALREEMDDGGIEAMLHDLMAMDISQFNVFAVPKTEALAEQQIMSLRGVDAWLFRALQNGAIGGHAWSDQGLEVPKSEAYSAYEMAARSLREYAPRDIATWTKAVKTALNGCWDERRRRAGESRARTLVFSALATCRAAFEQHVGSALPWEFDEAEGGL